MLKQSRMECPIERREVPGIEETQECHRVMLAAGLQLWRRLPAMGRERSDCDWTEGEDRTTRGSLAVPFGMAAVRGGVSARLDLEVLENISQKECVRKNRRDAKERDGSTSFVDRSSCG